MKAPEELARLEERLQEHPAAYQQVAPAALRKLIEYIRHLEKSQEDGSFY